MSGLVDLLSQQLSGPVVQQMSDKIDADPASTQQALSAALPMLIGGLARNANQSPEGARSLAGALEKDHDGSLIDGLSGLLGGGSGGGLGSLLGGGGSGSSGGLGDLLGGGGSGSGGGLGGMLGGGGSSAGGGLGDLLGGMLGGGAPGNRTLDGDGILGHVLGGKRPSVEHGISKASGLDAGKVSKLLAMLAPIVMGALGKAKRQQNLDAGGLANLLGQERARVEQKTPGMAQGGLLDLLDMDDDGSVADDVAKLGSALAGSGALGKLFGGK